jgi:hypothetical protein
MLLLPSKVLGVPCGGTRARFKYLYDGLALRNALGKIRALPRIHCHLQCFPLPSVTDVSPDQIRTAILPNRRPGWDPGRSPFAGDGWIARCQRHRVDWHGHGIVGRDIAGNNWIGCHDGLLRKERFSQ